MGLETGTYISDLVTTNPLGSDAKSTADDHLRLIKSCLKTTFPNVTGAVTKTHTELNTVTDRGLIAGQTWTGTHTFPATTYGVTAAVGSSGTALATLDYVNAQAFSAALPAQTGNSGKFLTTNGSSASWETKLNDSIIRFANNTDSTKQVAFSLSGITSGTTRTITLPDKSGTLAMTSDSGLILLASVNVTSVANIDFATTFTSTYNNYLVVFEGLLPASATSLKMNFFSGGVIDNGNSYITAPNESATLLSQTSAIDLSGATNILSTGIGISGNFFVNNANDATYIKTALGKSIFQSTATPQYISLGINAGYWPAKTVSGFRLYWNSGGNFAAVGRVKVYGLSN